MIRRPRNRTVRATGGLVIALLGTVVAYAAPAEVGRIEALIAEGRLDEAVASARATVAASPGDPDVRLAAAKALAARGRRMEKVIEVPGKPSDYEGPALRLNLSALESGRLTVGYDAALYEEALVHLAEGIRRSPTRKDLRMFQCYLLTDGARIERAEAALRDAIANLPRTADLAGDLVPFGAERTKRGDPAGGARLLGLVAEAFPSDARVHIDHGLSLVRLGRRKEAIAALDRAAALAPKDPVLQRKRAAGSMLLRDYARALAGYNAAHAVTGADEDRLGAAAATYGSDVATARALFGDLAVPAPSAHPAMVDLARAWQGAAEAGPGSAEAVALADRLIRDGQELLAVPVLDRALVARPDDESSRSKLADVLRALDCPALSDEVLRGRRK